MKVADRYKLLAYDVLSSGGGKELLDYLKVVVLQSVIPEDATESQIVRHRGQQDLLLHLLQLKQEGENVRRKQRESKSSK